MVTYSGNTQGKIWQGSQESISFDEEGILEKLKQLDSACILVRKDGKIGATNEEGAEDGSEAFETIAQSFPLPVTLLGDPAFKKCYNTEFAYYGGSMAKGISSEEMVIELGKAGFLASFGAGGLVPSRVESAIQKIQAELPNGPYAFNLIHSPFEKSLEQGAVDLFLKYGVTVIEASAYLSLTPQVVQYRAAGLSLDENNEIVIKNKIIAKISRTEVATRFMEPAPEKMLKALVQQGLITQQQAELAGKVPMADDITVEADSGGHTDNRPLVNLLPTIIALRNRIQEKQQYKQEIRVGAGGGIGTPEAALAAFMMGAAYIVTGSVNQGCLEAGSSDHVKKVLTQVEMADVIMAPASDMFEMGVKLQVLRRGTMFPMRALKLYEYYQNYNSIDEIPPADRDRLEKQVFRKKMEEIWQETVEFFKERDPDQIEKGHKDPKKKMALIFRWYLGLASTWANRGEPGREMDYQIWCGPAMGAFNEWVKGSCLETLENRNVVDVAYNIMKGAAYLYRLQLLKMQQISFPVKFSSFFPEKIQ